MVRGDMFVKIFVSDNSICFFRVVSSTVLSKRRDGRFPEERVRCYI